MTARSIQCKGVWDGPEESGYREAVGFDPLEGLAVNACRSGVLAASAVCFQQDILATDLVPEGIETEGWFCLGFRAGLRRGGSSTP
jgi:hypothetical protein